MSKKTFSSGLSSLLSSTEIEEKPQEKVSAKEESSKNEVLDHSTRSTFVVQVDSLKKLKALAYWERKHIKDVFEEAFCCYFKTKKADFLETALSEYEKSLKK